LPISTNATATKGVESNPPHHPRSQHHY
jgi:hypothetical protein